ncbi:hypothetical protein ATANTOWER_024973 [Ataeniobius toweri]|uniref:Uncharacterized protein n=1 Tax=Ataeniobius toweri TaxID=208326 RepID=A0ABU7BHI0_9TELE|nr:hypothetical protein [Ataeniobius toweri]
MPSITMENNVIHNNEDYGLILVKPGNGEELSHACEREEDPAEDKQEEAVSEPLSSTSSATKQDTQLSSNSAAFQLESAGINSTDGDMASAAGKKWQFGRQLSRNKEVSCSRPVQDLMEHQIFVSVQGNQFKRNGQGDFGIFFY